MSRTIVYTMILSIIVFSGGLEASGSGWYEDFASMVQAERAELTSAPVLFTGKVKNDFTVQTGGNEQILIDADARRCFIHLTEIYLVDDSGDKYLLDVTKPEIQEKYLTFVTKNQEAPSGDFKGTPAFWEKMRVVVKTGPNINAVTGKLNFSSHTHRRWRVDEKYLKKITAKVQVTTPELLKREKSIKQATGKIQQTVLEKYPDHASQQQMRFILPKTAELLDADDPAKMAAKAVGVDADKKFSEYGQVISKVQRQ